MFSPSFEPSGKQVPIPFRLELTERELLSNLATHLLESRLDSPWLTTEKVESAWSIADLSADPSIPICLCSGTGELLAGVLAVGFRLTPVVERATIARAADALAARLVVAMAPSAEMTADPDVRVLENIYRAGLGLPVRWHRLGEDQIEIMVREAQVFASLLNLAIRVGTEDESKGSSLTGLVTDQFLGGGEASLSFVDRATGGRPGMIGSITIVNPETFFASFSVNFNVGDRRVSRTDLADGTSLREALIELGQARRAFMNAQAS